MLRTNTFSRLKGYRLEISVTIMFCDDSEIEEAAHLSFTSLCVTWNQPRLLLGDHTRMKPDDGGEMLCVTKGPVRLICFQSSFQGWTVATAVNT